MLRERSLTMETSAYSRGRSQGGDLEDVESYPGKRLRLRGPLPGRGSSGYRVAPWEDGFVFAGSFPGGAREGSAGGI